MRTQAKRADGRPRRASRPSPPQRTILGRNGGTISRASSLSQSMSPKKGDDLMSLAPLGLQPRRASIGRVRNCNKGVGESRMNRRQEGKRDKAPGPPGPGPPRPHCCCCCC